MRILHAPINSANQAYRISRAQRKLGHKADCLIFDANNKQFEYDYNLNLSLYSSIMRKLVQIWNLFVCLFKYDIFHFHCAVTLIYDSWDVRILKFFGKKTVMQYWGSDIMQKNLSKIYTDLTEKEFNQIYPNWNDERIRKKIKYFDENLDTTIASAWSLHPFSPKSKVIRQSIDLDRIEYVGVDSKKKVPVVVHAPTNQLIKGTKFVLEAVERLKKEGYKFDFILLGKKKFDKTLDILRQADIIVDQLNMGYYGTMSIEGMAMGKPVICWINPLYKKYYQNCPIVSASRKNVYQKIKFLLDNPVKREKIGIEGRKYVEKYHDSMKIAKEMIKLYETL